MNHDNGAFAEYIVAKAAVQVKIPANISLEQAATLGVSLGTVVSSKTKMRASATASCPLDYSWGPRLTNQ